jgi:hypothetical protein
MHSLYQNEKVRKSYWPLNWIAFGTIVWTPLLLSLQHVVPMVDGLMGTVVDGWLMVQSYAARIKSQTNHCLDLENLIKSFSLLEHGHNTRKPHHYLQINHMVQG